MVSAAFLTPDAPDELERQITDGWAAGGEHLAGTYGNFSSHPDPEIPTRRYPPATAERVRSAKRSYDPDTVPAHNHNIAP